MAHLEKRAKLNVAINVPNSLPFILCDHWLAIVFEELLYPRRFLGDAYPVNVNANVGRNSKIDVTISLNGKIPEESQISEHWFYPGSGLSVAKLILGKMYGEPLEVAFPEKGVVFRFSLPIWTTEVDG